MKVLNHDQIRQKVRRLAYQILENNIDQERVYLAGINNNGLHFAKILLEQLEDISSDVSFELLRIRLSPADPLEKEVSLDRPVEDLIDQCIIIVDDVANTGRTIFYALKPLMNILPKKVEVAVLVDRKHKAFPIQVDYVGLSLATTLQEHINVKLKGVKYPSVALE